MNRNLFSRMGLALAAAGLVFSLAAPARAQSEASVAVSMLPVASVVGAVSATGAAAGAASGAAVLLSAGGTVFVIKAVQVSATGTVYLLERASDGVQVSLEVAGKGAAASVAGIGTAVAVSAIGAGVVLSAAGEVLAFVPNEIGRALLHNERVAQ
jgi:hypothetical protein